MTEKQVKQLYLIKRLLLLTIIAYVVVFFIINTSHLSIDNIRRFAESAKTALLQSSPNFDGVIAFESTDSIIISPFKDGYAVLSPSSLTVYSKDNHKYSVNKTNLKNPVMRVSERFILCYDRNGKKLMVFDSFNLLFEKSFSDIIINATISDSGMLAVLTQKYGYKGMLTVFNTSFEERFLWYSADTYPIDVAFNGINGVSVVTISQNMEKINSVLYTLNYSVGEERSIVTAESCFPLSTKRKHDGSIEIVTEAGIMSFRGNGVKKIYSYSSYTPELFFQSDKYTVISSKISTQDAFYSVVTLDVAGNILFNLTIENVRSISAFSDTILVLTNESLLVFDRTGEKIAETAAPEGATKIISEKQQIILIGTKQVNIIATSELIK